MNAVACPTQYGHKWSREGSKKWGDKFCENAVNADECEVIHMRKMFLNSHTMWWVFNLSYKWDVGITIYKNITSILRNGQKSNTMLETVW